MSKEDAIKDMLATVYKLIDDQLIASKDEFTRSMWLFNKSIIYRIGNGESVSIESIVDRIETVE